MSTMWLDDTDFDVAEYSDAELAEYGDGEFAEYDDSEAGELADYDLDGGSEGEDYDAESRARRPAQQRRLAQRRRVALARRRQAQARARARGRPTPTKPRVPASRSTVTAIRNLDLESKVSQDNARRAVSAQGKRMSRSEYAAVSGAAVNQFIESFGAPGNVYARAALRFSPLLLLSPQKRGTGFAAFIKDPRVVGAAAVAGITVLGENRKRFGGVSGVAILGPAELAQSTKDIFIADVHDRAGVVIAGEPVKWESSDKSIAVIDENTGEIEAQKKQGTVIITAKSDSVVRRVRLRVT